MTRALALVASLAIASTGLPLAASALVIDDFSTNQSAFVPPGGAKPTSVPSLSPAGPGPLDGSREILLERVAGFGIAAVDTNLTDSGRVSLSSGANTRSSATLIYDGTADGSIDPDGLNGGAGIDITEGGTNLLLEISARSDLDTVIRVQIHSGSLTDYLFADLFLPGNGTGEGMFQDLTVSLLSGFTAVGAGADVGAVGALQITLNETLNSSVDLQVKSIRTVIGTVVPEPASLALLGLGIASLAVAGRWRQA